MNSSAAPSEIGFLVFTNGRRDYGVYARSSDINEQLARWFDDLGRQVGKRLERDDLSSINLVGVTACPGLAGKWLAFRVFDSGFYENRPRTFGLVGVIATDGSTRTWRLAPTLAALQPPRPGAETYELPMPPALAPAAGLGEPFESLDRWEAGHPTCRQGEWQLFGAPAGFSLPDDMKPTNFDPPSRSRARIILLASLLLVVVAVAALTKMAMQWNNSKIAAPNLTVSQSFDRAALLKALDDSMPGDGRISSTLANTDSLAAIAVNTSWQLSDRMKKLQRELDANAGRPKVLQGYLDQARDDWKKPLDLGDRPNDPPPVMPQAAAVKQALQIHAAYKQALDELQLLHDASPEDKDFSKRVADFSKHLK